MRRNRVSDPWSRRPATVERRQRWRMRPTLTALEDRRLLSMIGTAFAPHLDRVIVVSNPTDTPIAPAGAHPDLGDPTIVVNNPTDTPVAGEIDLRQAIDQANTNGGNETITFSPTVFGTPQTITLNPTLGQLELSDTTGTEAIVGPPVGVTVSGGAPIRVFQVDEGVTASISGLTITDGTRPATAAGCTTMGGTSRWPTARSAATAPSPASPSPAAAAAYSAPVARRH